MRWIGTTRSPAAIASASSARVAALAAAAPPSPLTPYFCDRGEVDDRVDPVRGDAELERQLDVAAPDEVDERGHRRLLGGRGDPLT